MYRIPLRFLVDIGLVNFSIAFDTRFIFTLKQDLNKWFESNARVNPIPEPDAKIIIYEAPFISYPQIKLNENFEVYFNAALRTVKQMITYQQSFEINVGMQSINVGFIGANRQFAFLEISLVYN